MEILFTNDKALLQYHQNRNAVELIWLKPQDFDTYKAIFRMAIQCVEDKKAIHFVSDIRKQGVVGPQNSKWLQEEIIPKAIQLGLRKIAVIMDSDIFKQYYVNNIAKVTNEETELIKYFNSEVSAYHWLTAA